MLHQKGLEGVFQISVDSTVSLERKGNTNLDRSDVDGIILGVLKKLRLESQVQQGNNRSQRVYGIAPRFVHPSSSASGSSQGIFLILISYNVP